MLIRPLLHDNLAAERLDQHSLPDVWRSFGTCATERRQDGRLDICGSVGEGIAPGCCAGGWDNLGLSCAECRRRAARNKCEGEDQTVNFSLPIFNLIE